MCPTGYLPMDGDVSGGGLTGGYDATLQTCKKDCDARNVCHSFSHSISKEECKLMAESTPTQEKWQDYQFCSKGKQSFEKM